MEPIKLDDKKLQEMAEQYAMKGAEQAIKEFYTGYHSAYMDKVRQVCNDHMPNFYFDPVDITAEINKAIKQRMTAIANEAVAQSFIPLIEGLLSRFPNNITTSSCLFQTYGDYVKDREGDDFDSGELGLRMRSYPYFTKMYFCYKDDEEFVLFLSDAGLDKDGKSRLYTTHSLPMNHAYKNSKSRTMTLHIDGKTKLEMPFESDVLDNEFMRDCARLVMYQTKIAIEPYHEYHNNEDY